MKKVLHVPWKPIIVVLVSSLLMCMCQEEDVDARVAKHRKWMHMFLAAVKVPEYNMSLWPQIYEERQETNVTCRPSIDPVAADD